ncbi:DUF1109 domain-containing protein [Halomicroarcula sp. GCM10025709]|uniref:DUF1109 domain-containing protein n=1 Tax=Haloarcula TaxID=2237 RepID=UPI0024C368D7|nr:DUF1109 domain-containing protein [Halomicroarcula sp. YJ-61-S]
MNYDIDSGKLLYALGVVFATAAFLYFIRDVVFDLSITVKAALLFVAFVVFFVAGVALQRDVLDVVGFALAGIAYIVFVGYVVLRYEPSETWTFLLLAVSAGLFVTLGYALREWNLTLSRRTAIGIALGLVLVSTVLVGIDAVGGGVTYDLQTNESVTVEPPRATGQDRGVVSMTERVGTMTATNQFVFTRALDLPPLRGCLLGTDFTTHREVWVGYDPARFEQPNVIRGDSMLQFGVTADLLIDVNQTEPITYTIERDANCEGERERPTLVVNTLEADT